MEYFLVITASGGGGSFKVPVGFSSLEKAAEFAQGFVPLVEDIHAKMTHFTGVGYVDFIEGADLSIESSEGHIFYPSEDDETVWELVNLEP